MERVKFLIRICCWGCLLFSFSCTDSSKNKEDEPTLPVDRTVLIYMMADNSLASSSDINWPQIKEGAAGALSDGNLLVYIDRRYQAPVLYKVSPSGQEVVVKNYKEQNSASKQVFSQVLKDVFHNYPAREKGVVMWSHGEGWRYRPAEGVEAKLSPRWVGQDYEAGEKGTFYFNIPDIKQALIEAGVYLDFMIYDACFMSSIEVIYELRDRVANYLASPAEIMGNNTFYPDHTGFPYKKLIPALFADKIDYRKIAFDFYDYYNSLAIYGGLSDDMRSATIAWIETSKLDSLALLTRSMLESVSFDSIPYLDVEGVQTYDRASTRSYHLYYDLEHVMSRIFAHDQNTLNRWRAMLGQCVKARFHTDKVFGQKMFSVSGLSVYIPQRASNLYEIGYDQLQWYGQSGWSRLPGWSFRQE